jgi:hypothetical protein
MNDAFARRNKVALGRQLGVPGGDPAAGTVPSVVIHERGESMPGKKATHDGTYELNGHTYRIVKGDPLPDGAVMADAADDEPEANEVQEAPAPEENAKARGPKETTASTGPSEKA